MLLSVSYLGGFTGSNPSKWILYC